MTVSPTLNEKTAGQILHYALSSSHELRYQLQALNAMIVSVETEGLDYWRETRWRMLLDRVNKLSTDINTQVTKISH